MSRLTLRLFGSMEAILDRDQKVAFPSSKARALLAYLAMEADRPHQRDALAALLWPDYADQTARANFRNTLSKLRSVLGDRPGPGDDVSATPFLLVTRDSVQFNPASDHVLDVSAFHADLQRGTLAEAVRLYRGQFMEGLALPDSAGFDDWVALVREQLERAVCQALRALAEECEQRGQRHDAIAHARHQLEIEPWNEDAHRRLMRLLFLDGDRGAALLQYQTCRESLRHGLGVEPEPATTALYESMRSGMGRSEKPSMINPRNLPVSLFSMVGRDDELAQLALCLASSDCRLLTLTGPGGIGKTRLASEVAMRLAAAFADGVCFVPLSSVSTRNGIVAAIAQVLGLYFDSVAGVAPELRLFDYLHDRHTLLVLDSFEHLVGYARLARDILQAAPGVRILATSRARLNLPGERIFPLQGLAYPEFFPDPSMPGESASDGEGTYAALMLFREAAARARPGFALGADEVGVVKEICRRLEGMPLPILLAAWWTSMLSPSEILAQLDQDAPQRIDFLAAEWQGVSDRERNMRAVFDHSWDLLTDRDCDVLAKLSLFRAGFSAQAAKAVTGASLRDLIRLRDRSLIYRRASGRYDAHDLLRAYAADKLGDSADGAEAAGDRYAAYYARALERWGTEIRRGRGAAVHEMEEEWQNIRAAWDMALKRGRAEWIRQGAMGLAEFCHTEYRSAEMGDMFRSAAGALRERLAVGDSSASLLCALALSVAAVGISKLRLGERLAARPIIQEALGLMEQASLGGTDVRQEMPVILLWLGLTYGTHELDQSIALMRRGAEISQQIENGSERARTLMYGGHLLAMGGRHHEALPMLQEALDLWRELGNPCEELRALEALADLASRAGEFGQLVQWADAAEGAAERAEERGFFARARLACCYVLSYAGRFHTARPQCSLLLDFCEQRALGLPVAYALCIAGDVDLHLGRYSEAQDAFARALRICQDASSRMGVHACYVRLGLVALARDESDQARAWLGRCRGEFPDLEPREHDLGGFRDAHVSALQGCLTGRWDLLPHRWAHRMWGGPLPAMALSAAKEGDAERAVELWALARKHPMVGNSQWFDDVCGRQVAFAAATLPEMAVQAAAERGLAREWQPAIEEFQAFD